MAAWLRELRLLAEAEYHGRRVVATLATVGLDGSPRARVVIVRSMFEDGSVLTTTSSLSEKVPQIKANASAEMVFWFPQERQQFRVRGQVEFVTEPGLMRATWDDLGDSSRATFFWPEAGLPRHDSQQFLKKVEEATAPPDTFVVLRLRANEVESLDLNEHPHLRRRWRLLDRAQDQWQMDTITP